MGIHTSNWVNSAQDRDYWRSLVNAALNFLVSKAIELVNVPGIEPATSWSVVKYADVETSEALRTTYFVFTNFLIEINYTCDIG